MKRETVFLKVIVFLLALPVFALCIWIIPHVGGELAQAYPDFWVYFLLGSAYGSALVYFAALYQALRLLNYIDKNNAFSHQSVRALKLIRNYAFIISVLYVIASPFLYFIADQEDAPGIMAFGVIIILASATIGVFAAVLKALLKNAIDMKAENELTI
jgi:hypothetical protein